MTLSVVIWQTGWKVRTQNFRSKDKLSRIAGLQHRVPGDSPANVTAHITDQRNVWQQPSDSTTSPPPWRCSPAAACWPTATSASRNRATPCARAAATASAAPCSGNPRAWRPPPASRTAARQMGRLLPPAIPSLANSTPRPAIAGPAATCRPAPSPSAGPSPPIMWPTTGVTTWPNRIGTRTSR